MNISFRAAHPRSNRTGAAFQILTAICLVALAGAAARAQQKVSRHFPAGKNVRLELKNLSGTITVESWARDEVRITATMESPAAHFNPQQTENGIIIDLVGDNRGRGDVGDVNFKIEVPARSSVDLETRRGQITVSNIQGDLVRAHISTEGDIELSGINASRVFAFFFQAEVGIRGLYVTGVQTCALPI